MELKYISSPLVTPCSICSNRTFMELNLGSVETGISPLPGSNRTFMELK